MIPSFTADAAKSELSFDAIVAGVTCSDPAQQLMFQRSVDYDPNDEDDWGLCLEFNQDGQVNAGYDCVQKCTITRDELKVDLSHPFGRDTKFEGFQIALSLDDETYQELVGGLKSVFKQMDGLLELTVA